MNQALAPAFAAARATKHAGPLFEYAAHSGLDAAQSGMTQFANNTAGKLDGLTMGASRGMTANLGRNFGIKIDTNSLQYQTGVANGAMVPIGGMLKGVIAGGRALGTGARTQGAIDALGQGTKRLDSMFSGGGRGAGGTRIGEAGHIDFGARICRRNCGGPHGLYDDAPYHTGMRRPGKNLAPLNGQAALESSINFNGSRRLAIEGDSFVILDPTRGGVYHGHLRTWAELDPRMRAAYIRAGLTNSRGRIL